MPATDGDNTAFSGRKGHKRSPGVSNVWHSIKLLNEAQPHLPGCEDKPDVMIMKVPKGVPRAKPVAHLADRARREPVTPVDGDAASPLIHSAASGAFALAARRCCGAMRPHRKLIGG